MSCIYKHKRTSGAKEGGGSGAGGRFDVVSWWTSGSMTISDVATRLMNAPFGIVAARVRDFDRLLEGGKVHIGRFDSKPTFVAQTKHSQQEDCDLNLPPNNGGKRYTSPATEQ